MVNPVTSRRRRPQSESRQIVVHLVGGLGNQIFSYFAGLRFAEVSNRQIRVNTALLARGAFAHKNSSIEDLLDPDQVVSKNYWYSRISLVIRKGGNGVWATLITDETKNLSLHLNRRRNLHLLGYFQSSTWETDRATKAFLDDFRKRTGSAWLSDIRVRAELERPICIHIRRGDYMSLKEKQGVLGSEYFRLGIEKLRAAGIQGPLWLFSDSPADLQQLPEFRFEEDQVLIQEPSNVPALDVMAAMGACSAFVISNSTFSYWAAVLSGSQVVIAPKVWARSNAIEGPRTLDGWLLEEPHWL